jgi:hypothetical protein
MGSELGLSRENSETIGFVLTSLLRSAIDLDELKEWCYHVIGHLEVGESPGYLFDLAEYKGVLAGIYKPLGFVPSWKHTDEDANALYGIAIKRGKSRYEWPIEKDAALAALAQRPAIEERFRKTFPFISF